MCSCVCMDLGCHGTLVFNLLQWDWIISNMIPERFHGVASFFMGLSSPPVPSRVPHAPGPRGTFWNFPNSNRVMAVSVYFCRFPYVRLHLHQEPFHYHRASYTEYNGLFKRFNFWWLFTLHAIDIWALQMYFLLSILVGNLPAFLYEQSSSQLLVTSSNPASSITTKVVVTRKESRDFQLTLTASAPTYYHPITFRTFGYELVQYVHKNSASWVPWVKYRLPDIRNQSIAIPGNKIYMWHRVQMGQIQTPSGEFIFQTVHVTCCWKSLV